MSDEEILNCYFQSAPGIIISNNNTCVNCSHLLQDSEVDTCSIHRGMYHDWDMPEEQNFIYSLRCKDFNLKE